MLVPYTIYLGYSNVLYVHFREYLLKPLHIFCIKVCTNMKMLSQLIYDILPFHDINTLLAEKLKAISWLKTDNFGYNFILDM